MIRECSRGTIGPRAFDRAWVAVGLLGAIVLTPACATPIAVAAATRPEAADEPPRQEDIAPIADHHVHLLSPAGVDLLTPPLLPPVQLPPELAQLLNARNELRTNQEALEKLYTEDATYFTGGTRGFALGREAVAGWVKWTISDNPYRVVPVTYSLRGSSAVINGYFMDGRNFETRFGFSVLALVEEGGQWRIASETYVFQEPPPPFENPKTAADAIAELNEVGTRVAAVLSDAYYFDAVRPERVADAYAKVRAENDWTAEQVGRFPGRLVAFCSFNPLKDYALQELDRCAETGGFTGLKLNFNAAQVYLRDPDQVAKVRAVFERANHHRLAIIVHLRTALVPDDPEANYGAEDARIFLDQLVAAAPDVPVQVAHLWGGESYSADALEVFSDAFANDDPLTRNLYFDLSGVSHYGRDRDLPEIVERMRQIGMDRMLYGSDSPPSEAWERFRQRVPLTEEELSIVARNVAPYFRGLWRKSP